MKAPLIVLYLIISSIVANAQPPNFRHLGAKDGLTHPTVYSIHQDETGIVWIGTRRGLNRYDGNTVDAIELKSSKGETYGPTIWKIEGYKNDNLLIKAEGRIVKFDVKNNITESVSDKNIHDFTTNDSLAYLLTSTAVEVINPYSNQDIKQITLKSTSEQNQVILLAKDGEIWVGGKDNLLRINKSGSQSTILTKCEVTTLFQANNGTIYVGTKEHGVLYIDENGILTKTTIARGTHIRSIAEDSQDNLLIGTFDGLYIVSPTTGITRHLTHESQNPYSLSHSSIYAVFKDCQQTMWIGTYFGGVSYYNDKDNDFRMYTTHEFNPSSSNISVIGNITQDDSNNLWVATEGQGLFKINIASGHTIHYQHKPGGLSHNNIKSIYFNTKNKKLYIGTHTGGLSILNTKQNSFGFFSSIEKGKRHIPNNVINKMTNHGNLLFLVTQGGVIAIDMEKEEVISDYFKNLTGLDKEGTVDNLFVDTKQRMWITNFANEVKMYDFKNGSLTHYQQNQMNHPKVRNGGSIQIFEDTKGTIYFTNENMDVVIFNEATQQFNQLSTPNHKLISNRCFKIINLVSGKMLISSPFGFSVFDPVSNTSDNYSITDKVPLSGIIEENGLFIDSHGTIYLAGINGLVTFTEESLKPSAQQYNLFFSKLSVNNQEIEPGQENKILRQSMPYTGSITLKEHQAFFSITFASSNYTGILKKEYEYRLEGLSNNWPQTTSPTITYNNLAAGSYILMVREQNSHPERKIELLIEIKPPFLKSLPAFILYALLLATLVIGIILYFRSRANFQAKLAIERNEKMQQENLNQAKLKFFTNISHEFRTPLTLIINYADLIRQDATRATATFVHSSKIIKNSTILRNLINELLDFRKQESGRLKIRFQHLNMAEFVREVYASFKEYAYNTGILYSLDSPKEEVMVWFDPDQMQKVLFNLIGNAFKHTKKDQRIKVFIHQDVKQVSVTVTDSGIGIQAGEMEKIFDPYYQAENLNPNATNVTLSTGIGLALSKGIMDLHGGTISVTSTPNEGASFTVTLLLGDRHIRPEDKVESTQPLALNIEVQEPITVDSANFTSDKHDDTTMPTMLIVDDNEDLRELLT